MESAGNNDKGTSEGYFAIDESGEVLESGKCIFEIPAGSQILSLINLTDICDGHSFSFTEEEITNNSCGFYRVDSLADGEECYVEQNLTLSSDRRIEVRWRQLTDAEVQTAKKISRRFKKDFLEGIGHITHDFNNVLSVALGHSELAVMVSDPQKRERHFKLSVEALRKIRNLLKKVLLYRHHLDTRTVEDFDAASLLRECFNELKDKFPDQFDLHFDFDGEVILKQSRSRMKGVFMNILVNSCESFPENAKGIITVKIITADGKFIDFTVKDNGHGIKENVIGNIFDPFFSTHHNLESAGVGLSLVKGVIDDIGGELEINSKAEEGTEVRVRVLKNL